MIPKKILNQQAMSYECGCSACEMEIINSDFDKDKLYSAGVMLFCLFLASIMLMASCIHGIPAKPELLIAQPLDRK